MTKGNKKNETYKKNNNQDPYGYDFVPELSHALNIDEQKTDVRRLEKIGKCRNKTNKV